MNFFTIPEGGRLLFWGLSVVRASLACFAMAFIWALTGTAGGLIPLVSATGTIVAPFCGQFRARPPQSRCDPGRRNDAGRHCQDRGIGRWIVTMPALSGK